MRVVRDLEPDERVDLLLNVVGAPVFERARRRAA
jgi:hypothetical protein